MAKKVVKPLEDPPAASSSDDNEVETSSDEDEGPEITPSTATKQSLKIDSGAETDSDSEAEPSPKPASAGKAIAVVKSKKKRPSEGTSRDVEAKKAKKVSGEDNKKAYFQRLWSEEDEISLLQGMIDYKADTGKSPYDDMNGFYEFVKKAISFDVSKVQFGDKIRWLKKKYLGKDKESKQLAFTKAHDKKCFNLAKYIWGSDGLGLESAVKSKKTVEGDKEVLGSGESSKSNGKSKKVEEDNQVLVDGRGSESSNWFDKSFIGKCITICGVDEQSVKERWSKVPMEIKKRIEDKFKLVQAKEYELLKHKTDILSEVNSVLSQPI